MPTRPIGRIGRGVAKTVAKKSVVEGVATKTATKAAAPGFMKLLSGKGLGAAMKAHPLTSGMGIFFLLQMVLNQMKKAGGTALQQNLQQQQIEGQMERSPEDVYYQAMLPQLSQQRQTAQNALLQAIMSGGGEVPMVPGERTIGG